MEAEVFASFDHEFWTKDRIKAFCDRANPVEFRKGTSIWCPDDVPASVFLIESGRVDICYPSADGTMVPVFHNGPGEVLGVKYIFRPSSRPLFYVVAGMHTRVWEISKARFLDLLAQDFQLLWHFFERFSSRFEIITKKMLNSVLLTTKSRLILALLELMERFDAQEGNTACISITQKDLGNMLSISHQTTSVYLKELQQKGLLKTGHRKIWLLDLNALYQEIK